MENTVVCNVTGREESSIVIDRSGFNLCAPYNAQGATQTGVVALTSYRSGVILFPAVPGCWHSAISIKLKGASVILILRSCLNGVL